MGKKSDNREKASHDFDFCSLLDDVDKNSKMQAIEVKERLDSSIAIHSGSLALDVAILGGGYYPGRAYDWVGPESGGKCILGNSYVPTENGIFKIKDLVGKINGFKEKNINIYTKNNKQLTSHIFHTKSNIYKLYLQDGRTLGGTPEHPILVITKELNLEWKQLKDIKVNDFICSSFGKKNFAISNCNLNFIYEEKRYNNTSYTAKSYPIATSMNTKLAKFLGYLTANGSYDNSYGINFCTNNVKTQKNYKKLIKDLFDLDLEFNDSDCPNLHIRSTQLTAYIKYLGLNSLAKNKVIPWSILQSNEECVKAFIEGYLSCDSYLPDSSAVYLCSASQNLMKQMQVVLNEFGIFSSFSKKKGPVDYSENSYYYLHIPTVFSQTFFDTFSLDKNISISKGWSKNYIIPYLAANLAKAREVVSKNGVYSNGKISQKISLLGSFNDEMTKGRLLSNEGHLTCNALPELNIDHLKIINSDLYNKVSILLKENLMYTKVAKISKSKKLHDVYDLTVPNSSQFIANNIVVHNTTHGNAALGQGLIYIPKYTCGNYFDFEGSLDKKWFLNIAGMPNEKPENIFGMRTKDDSGWAIRPKIRLYKPSFGEQCLLLLIKQLKSLPDKCLMQDEWWYTWTPVDAKTKKKTGGLLAKDLEAMLKTLKIDFDKKLLKSSGLYGTRVPNNYGGCEGITFIDSYAAMTPRQTAEDDSAAMAQQGRMFGNYINQIKSLISAKGYTIIGVNQVRKNPNAGYGDPEYNPGGEALKHFCDLRNRIGSVSNPNGGGPIEIENNGRDEYRHFIIRNKKNKITTPYAQIKGRIWTKRGGKTGCGIDPVLDTITYLQLTGQLDSARRGFQIILKDGSKAAKNLSDLTFKYEDLKNLILDKEVDTGKRTASFDLRKHCLKQIKKGIGMDLYYASQGNDFEPEEDEDDDE